MESSLLIYNEKYTPCFEDYLLTYMSSTVQNNKTKNITLKSPENENHRYKNNC
jgi:hypothetical protein